MVDEAEALRMIGEIRALRLLTGVVADLRLEG